MTWPTLFRRCVDEVSIAPLTRFKIKAWSMWAPRPQADKSLEAKRKRLQVFLGAMETKSQVIAQATLRTAWACGSKT